MISVGIRQGPKSCHHTLPKVVSITWRMANNRMQAVSSATKETI